MGVEYKFDKKKLETIIDFLSKSHTVKIGIVGSSEIHVYDNGLDSVQLGLVHEFGSKKRNIPERSFLRKTKANYEDKFLADVYAAKEKIFKQISEGQGDKFLNQVGAKWVGWVHATFKAEGPGWPPHSDRNLARRQQTGRAKGNTGPEHWPLLQDTGALLRSISHEVVSE
jgi:hypothetical protein